MLPTSPQAEVGSISVPSTDRDYCQVNTNQPQKVSPNSSPKVTPDGQFGGGNGAMPSVEKEVAKTACFPMKNG